MSKFLFLFLPWVLPFLPPVGAHYSEPSVQIVARRQEPFRNVTHGRNKKRNLDMAAFYFEKFVDDLKALNVELPQEFPRASDHIQDDITFIQELEKKGFTYTISGGVYFDISKFPSYGKLGNISLEALKDGARLAVNPEKKNPADFVLWKLDSKLGWESFA
jgi:cysteinyl-tRNA synthetase